MRIKDLIRELQSLDPEILVVTTTGYPECREFREMVASEVVLTETDVSPDGMMEWYGDDLDEGHVLGEAFVIAAG